MNKPFPQIEEEILKFWQEKKIFEKSLEVTRDKKLYSFFDGPPFATGLPHYGHILSSTVKDIFGRYWTQKGYHVPRRWGWDCHGLPIENIIEKEMKISGKKQIEEKGIENFNQACQSAVLKYAHEWGRVVDRIGRWVDFENSYKTMDSTYSESVWWAIKEIWKKNLLYQGRKVLLYCPRCETPISNFEVLMDNNYENVIEDTVTVKFKLKPNNKFPDNTSILAWTTTPWTLPENIALAVGPDIEYVLATKDDEHFILAKDRISKKYNLKIEKTIQSLDLIGQSYEPLFDTEDQPTAKSGAFKIYAAHFVSTEEGTGVVHIATGYGEDDYNLGLTHNLPIADHLNEQGIFNQNAPPIIIGRYFKDADSIIRDDLQSRQLLFSHQDYAHDYPFCWRCQMPLYYKAIPAWFINIQKIKPKLLAQNENINWYPAYLKHGRFKNGLESAPDWNISRNRYWATPLPIWKCQSDSCGQIEVIGSLSELVEKSINYQKVYQSENIEDVDLHRPQIDQVYLKCQNCQSTMKRIPEVVDCWIESGSMPYAELHYPFENQEEFKKRFPADFISEYIAQTRAWFYVMHVLSVILFDQNSYKNVLNTGTILNEKGEKMSKSKKNFPDPEEIINKYGADCLRFYEVGSVVMKSENLFFSEKEVDEKYKKIILLILNVLFFYKLYQTEPAQEKIEITTNIDILDQWILSLTNNYIQQITDSMNSYDTVTSCRLIENFVDQLSTWYLRRSRDRFKTGDNFGIKIFGYVLLQFAKTVAPIMPYLSEHVYSEIGGAQESVHLDAWPSFDQNLIDPDLVSEMETVRQLSSLALSARMEAGIKVRQPLGEMRVNQKLTADLSKLLQDEANVKEVKEDQKDKNSKDWQKAEKGDLKIWLNTELTLELKEEGLVRELIRQINERRKNQNLTIKDQVEILYSTEDEKLSTIIEKNSTEITKNTIATKITKSDQSDKMVQIKVGDGVMKIFLKKI